MEQRAMDIIILFAPIIRNDNILKGRQGAKEKKNTQQKVFCELCEFVSSFY